MRVLIATGGTGGHLFPAQSLAKELKGECLFIGKGLSQNPFFSNKDFPFVEIPAGKKLLTIGKGVAAAWKVIRDFKPDVVVGFGSFYAAPGVIAARFEGVRTVLHEANAWPGRVNRFFSKSATTGIHFPETAQWLKGRCEEVKMPVRHPLSSLSQEEARAHFGLDPDRLTLLVFGGSQGADQLYRPVESAAWELNAQVIHFYGQGERPKHRAKAYVADFEHRMDLAWCAADISITRAGASTLAEQIEWEKPSILIPWAGASEDHQTKNADAMVRLGGAQKMSNELTMQIAQMDRAVMIDAIQQFKQRPRKSFLELLSE